MEKFKNLYGDSRRAHNLGVKKHSFKPKYKKRSIEKSLKEYGDNLTDFLMSTIDLAGRVPKNVRKDALQEVTQQAISKISKNRKKKRKSKSPTVGDIVTEIIVSSDEEPFDKDMELASLIKTNLQRNVAKTKKRVKKTIDTKFDADKYLENLLKQKLSKPEYIIDSDSSEEKIEVSKVSLDEVNDLDFEQANNSSGSFDENNTPGKFVLLKTPASEEDEHESDKQSLVFSLGSNEAQSPPNLSNEEPLETSTKEINLDEQHDTNQNHTSGNKNESMETDIYENFDDYDPGSENIDDMLYDTVFETTLPVNKEQTNNTSVLKEYGTLQNVSIEPIAKQTSLVNGIVDREKAPLKPVEKTTEDVVEILSSDDDDEEKTNEKTEQIATDNHVSEEVSDEIFNDVKFYKANQQIVVVLKHPTRLYFWGKLVATSLFGSVCVLGCNLQTSIPYPIYSPCGLGKMYFETVPNEETFNPMMLFAKLEKTGMTAFDMEQIVTSIRPNDVVLYLQNNNTILTRFLNFVFTHPKLFPTARRVSNNQTDGDYKTTLQTLFYKQEECFNGLNINDSWYGITNYVYTKQFNAKVLVCGGKGVGKSTLNRFLLNSHVNNTTMIYVDLDVGQPEFGISGTISASKINGPVFGPSYTNTRTKFLKMRFVRDLDVMDNLYLYLNSVKKMVEELWDEYKDFPWVINTMGFVKTFGESVNVAIIRMVKPDFVIQIHDKDLKNNYQGYMRTDFVYNYDHCLDIELPETPSNFEHMLIMTEANTKKISIEAKQIRDLNVISYFSNVLNEDSLYLTDVVPQMAPLSCLKIWISETLVSDLIRNSLNGKMVALCQVDSETPTEIKDGLQIITKDLEIGPVCLGFGIVRGVSENEIFVLTPLRSTGLSGVNCIASCCQTLPSSLFTKCSPNVTHHVPYVSLKRERPVTSQIPKRNFHLQRTRSASNTNGKQM